MLLPKHKATPEFLDQLLDYNNSSEATVFKDNIRLYNFMFQFTSLGAKIDHS